MFNRNAENNNTYTRGKIELSKQENVEQLAVGNIHFGDAGITRKHRKQGYVYHLCTMNKEGRCVDIALSEMQLLDMLVRLNTILEIR